MHPLFSAWIPQFIFLLTYTGVAIGRIPGLKLDRTGIAMLGAIAMIVSGTLPVGGAAAGIDVPTILLLFSLMIVSAQLRLGGFYTRTALRLSGLCRNPALFLLISMVVGALLSAALNNDIICLAFTPVLAVTLTRAGLNPVPYLLGLAVSSNIGSAATIIGNPQNMLIGQVGRLDFGSFLAWCTPPVLLSLSGGYAVIYLFYRKLWRLPDTARPPAAQGEWPPYDGWQSNKGLAVAALLIVLFFTPLPRELSALGAAGVLLCSRRMNSRRIVDLVDWHLLALFCALFVVIAGISTANLPERLLSAMSREGMDIQQPVTLTLFSTLLSNLVSNVPAVMLLVRFLDTGQPHQWYTLALASTFAGNLLTIGSIANLIVIEQARSCGIRLSFATHAKVGLPVTAWSLLVLVGWIRL